MIQGFSSGLIGNRELIYETDLPSFQRDFASLKTLDHGYGPSITFTRASNATFFDVNGVLQTAGNNVPRFDHDPVTGASRGLLIEEARTNLLERSSEFDNAYWSKNRASITASAIAAPDGTVTADILVEDSTATSSHNLVAVRTSSNETVTFSVFAKSKERTRLLLQLSNFFNSAANAQFDLSAGTVTSPATSGSDYTFASSSITSVGNGWYRCVLTATKGAVNTTNNAQMFLHNGTSESYTGDGTSGLYIWGAQLEAGAFPTSYIPTTTAQATRSADSAVVTPISSFYNQAEGTLFAQSSNFSNNEFPAVVSINNQTASNRINIISSTSTQNRFAVLTSGVSQLDIPFSNYVSGSVVSQIISARANDFAASVNGATVQTDTSGSMPTVTRMEIGLQTGGLHMLNGHIRKIAYWPKRLTNTLLEQLTT